MEGSKERRCWSATHWEVGPCGFILEGSKAHQDRTGTDVDRLLSFTAEPGSRTVWESSTLFPPSLPSLH